MSMAIALQGFGLGATMIIPIGAQNAYVLNQGINRNHHLATATICSVCDVIFISLGIFGGGTLVASHPTLLLLITLAGIAFLSFYGALSLRNAFKTATNEENSLISRKSQRTVLLGALAVTLLNPHLYLDTVVILGPIGAQFVGNERIAFAFGTIMASFVWFYSLSVGAAKLGPFLSKPNVKTTINVIVAIMMFTIAFYLAKELWINHLG
jgi:L-lysine exporter family protein LysE/ArgO